MSHHSSLVKRLLGRELGLPTHPSRVTEAVNWSRLSLESALKHHEGCVNHLSFNQSGSLLCSGSDDTQLCVWDVERRAGQPKVALPTGHTANIFCARFVPESGDAVVVTCAGDSEVRLHHLEHRSTDVHRHHTDRVKKVEVDAACPSVLVSGSEDGTVRQLDLRDKNIMTLVQVSKAFVVQEVNSISCARRRPWLLAVGASDDQLRVYDRRVMTQRSSSTEARRVGTASECKCVKRVSPAALDVNFAGSCITGVCFDEAGDQVLANYSGDFVYLYDVVVPRAAGSSRWLATDMFPTTDNRNARRRGGGPDNKAGGGCGRGGSRRDNRRDDRRSGAWDVDDAAWDATARHGRSADLLDASARCVFDDERTFQQPLQHPGRHATPAGGTPSRRASSQADVAAEDGWGRRDASARQSPPPQPARRVREVAEPAGPAGAEDEESAGRSRGVRTGPRGLLHADDIMALIEDGQLRVRVRQRTAVATALTERGEELLEAGAVAGAMRYGQRAAMLHPTLGQAHYLLARCHTSLGELQQALEEAELAMGHSWSRKLQRLTQRLRLETRAQAQAGLAAQAGQARQAAQAGHRGAVASLSSEGRLERRHETGPSGGGPATGPSGGVPATYACASETTAGKRSRVQLAGLPPPEGGGTDGQVAGGSGRDLEADLEPDCCDIDSPGLSGRFGNAGSSVLPSDDGQCHAAVGASPANALDGRSGSSSSSSSDDDGDSSDDSVPGLGHDVHCSSNGGKHCSSSSSSGGSDVVGDLTSSSGDSSNMDGASDASDDDDGDADDMSFDDSLSDDGELVYDLQRDNDNSDDSDGGTSSCGSDDDGQEPPPGTEGVRAGSLIRMLGRELMRGQPGSLFLPSGGAVAHGGGGGRGGRHASGGGAGHCGGGGNAATGSSSGTAWAMRYRSHCNLRTIKDVAFVGAERMVAAGSDDGRMMLWDRETGRLVTAVKADRHVVNCVAQQPDGALIASCGIDNSVKLWSPSLPQPQRKSSKFLKALAYNEMLRHQSVEAHGRRVQPFSVSHQALLLHRAQRGP